YPRWVNEISRPWPKENQIGSDFRKKTISIFRIQRVLLKKIFFIIWLIGFVLLCTFRVPVKYYQFYDRFVVINTHIFSDKGKILAGQFVLYTVIWSAFIYLTYLALSYFKK